LPKQPSEQDSFTTYTEIKIVFLKNLLVILDTRSILWGGLNVKTLSVEIMLNYRSASLAINFQNVENIVILISCMHFGTYLRPRRYGKIKGTCIFLTRSRNISIRQLSTNEFLEFLFTMCIILDQSSSNARCILIIEKTAGKLKKFISILLNELQWPVRREFFTSQIPNPAGPALSDDRRLFHPCLSKGLNYSSRPDTWKFLTAGHLHVVNPVLGCPVHSSM